MFFGQPLYLRFKRDELMLLRFVLYLKARNLLNKPQILCSHFGHVIHDYRIRSFERDINGIGAFHGLRNQKEGRTIQAGNQGKCKAV